MKHKTDSLRGLCALLVMFHHVVMPLAGAQWVAVDAFFVMSGYFATITLAKGECVSKFYFHRIQRLYPLLLLVCLIYVIIDRNAVDEVMLVLSSTSNWARCFDKILPAMAHTWSLSVTEQFYLVWPLIFLCKPKIKYLIATVIVITVTRAILIPHDPVFYNNFTPLRVDGLLIGAIAAMIPKTEQQNRAGKIATIGFILVAIVLPIMQVRYNYWTWIVLALQGFVAIMLRNPFVDTKWLGWIGARSYGIFVWHLPVRMLVSSFMPEVYANSLETAWMNLIPLTIIYAMTFGLAYLSYRFLERPLIEWGKKSHSIWLMPVYVKRAFVVL